MHIFPENFMDIGVKFSPVIDFTPETFILPVKYIVVQWKGEDSPM